MEENVLLGEGEREEEKIGDGVVGLVRGANRRRERERCG